jgi:hypothetical protein
VYDAIGLHAGDGDLAARFGRFNVLAFALVAGGSLQAEVAGVMAVAGEDGMTRRPEQVVAASRLGDDVCLVRIAGTTTETVGRTLRALLRFVPARLADDPWIRKW